MVAAALWQVRDRQYEFVLRLRPLSDKLRQGKESVLRLHPLRLKNLTSASLGREVSISNTADKVRRLSQKFSWLYFPLVSRQALHERLLRRGFTDQWPLKVANIDSNL